MLCDDLKVEKTVSVCRNSGNFLRFLQKGKIPIISHISIINVCCFVSIFIFVTFKRNKIEFKRRSSLLNDRKAQSSHAKIMRKNSQEGIQCQL